MKHILILSLNNDPSSFPGTEHAGGQTKYVLELTKNLLFSGYSVDVFTIGQVGQAHREEFVPGAVVTRFFRDNGKSYGYDIDVSEIHAISKNIANYADQNYNSFDLVLCCYWVGGLAGIMIRDIAKCPLVVSFCSLAGFKFAVGKSEKLASRFKQEKILGDSADAIIATNESEKQLLIFDYGFDEEKISLIPRGVDFSVFHP